MEERGTTVSSCAKQFVQFPRTDLSRGGVCCRKTSWLKSKIVCAFFSIFDGIAQSGRYAPGQTDLKSLVVEGEQRYRVHMAVDRFTGQVIDKKHRGGERVG